MITDSRVRNGELTFGSQGGNFPVTSFACQASNVRVTPSYDDDGDAIETLCGDTISPGQRETWVLAGTSVQDFDDPEGFLTFCYEHATEPVPFTWQPNTVGAPTWAGVAVVRALEEGGDVNTRLTTDWEFPINGRPTRTYGTTAAAPAPPGTVAA